MPDPADVGPGPVVSVGGCAVDEQVSFDGPVRRMFVGGSIRRAAGWFRSGHRSLTSRWVSNQAWRITEAAT